MKEQIKQQFKDQCYYTDKRAAELADMFIFFTEGYNIEPGKLILNYI